MSAPMSYIQLSNSTGTWRIATSIQYQTQQTRNSMLCFASDGLFEGGENENEAMERTYSDGSILPPTPRYRGVDFTIDVALYSLNRTANIAALFENFKQFLKSGTMNFTSDYSHDLTVQTQRVELVKQDWKGTARLVVRVYFKAAEAG